MEKISTHCNNFSILLKAAFFGLILVYSAGCQEGSIEINNPTDDEILVPDSQLSELLGRISLKDGSFDNIIDRVSCLSLVYPYNVLLNGEIFIIANEENLQTIRDTFDLLAEDLSIVFPVTGILPDHTQIEINSSNDLISLTQDCVEGGADLDIECIDVKFPINLSVYEVANQRARIEHLENDEDLLSFVSSQEEEIIASLLFPVQLLVNQEEIEVESYAMLEEELDKYSSDCDEADTINFSIQQADNLTTLLIDNQWKVHQFKDTTTETNSFDEIIIAFSSNGTMTATKGAIVDTGTWQVTENTDQILELNWDVITTPLVWLNDDWEVTQFNSVTVIMRAPGNGPSDKKLILNNKI